MFRRRRTLSKESSHEIVPEELLLDSENLPEFDTHQFEGKIVSRVGFSRLVTAVVIFCLVATVFSVRLWSLQVEKGEAYTEQSENNRLRKAIIFAHRGLIYDRNGEELAWNTPSEDVSGSFLRHYSDTPGLAHVLGYLKYPQKDSAGFYYDTSYTGMQGVERSYNNVLAGRNGEQVLEVNALLDPVSDNIVEKPQNGSDLWLSIDADVQSGLYTTIENTAQEVGFEGGAGVIMDIHTGEIIALTSYPEYNPQKMTDADDVEYIQSVMNDERFPFLNRVTDGLYTPGSIVKPYMAVAALTEGVIGPEDNILSTGEIRVPNPYSPGDYTRFTDWKAHGLVDVVDALAVSSNVYFYVVSGGYKDNVGFGIRALERYVKAFGLGQRIGTDELDDVDGVIPTPEWKEKVFDGEPWRLGDTYNTSIGQYGFQVTPIQMVRAVASIARNGVLVTPTFQKTEAPREEVVDLEVPAWVYKTVREGMREGAIRGTAAGLNVSYVNMAGKTGTAELGSRKQLVNSWVTGFYPYENPRYAFALVMERGPRSNLIGATSVFRRFIDWLHQVKPEYIDADEPLAENAAAE